MTVRRGQSWGSQGPLAAERPVFADDAALRAHIERARRGGEALGEVGLTGGDLARTVGAGPGAPAMSAGPWRPDAVRLPVDVVRAEVDGETRWFVAHLVAHRRWWAGEAAVAMNAEWLGSWKLGPRAHPNDGLVDVTVGQLGWRDRLRARRRARSGDHLPHPDLRTSRAAGVTLRFDRPTPVWLDGEPLGRAERVVLTVEPDALVIVV